MKRYKKLSSATVRLAKLLLLVVPVCWLSASCASAPVVEYQCPFACPGAAVDDEELDGAALSCPATLDWKREVEHMCDCT